MKKVVLKNLAPVVSVQNTSEHKIYAFKGAGDYIYKLHHSGSKWGFIDMGSSICFANGSFASMENALTYTMSDRVNIYEFDNQKEFFKWALKELSDK